MLWEHLTSEQAKHEIYTLLKDLETNLRTTKYSSLNISPLPEYDAIPRFITPLHLSQWLSHEQQAVMELFPLMSHYIEQLKDDIRNHINISQERLSEVDNKLHALWEALTNDRAKDDIYTLLQELKTNLPATGNPSLKMRPLPEYTPTSNIANLTEWWERRFTSHIYPSRWSSNDQQILKEIFPNILPIIQSLKKDIRNHINVSQQRFAEVYDKLNTLSERLTSERAKNDIYNLFKELQ